MWFLQIWQLPDLPLPFSVVLISTWTSWLEIEEVVSFLKNGSERAQIGDRVGGDPSAAESSATAVSEEHNFLEPLTLNSSLFFFGNFCYHNLILHVGCCEEINQGCLLVTEKYCFLLFPSFPKYLLTRVAASTKSWWMTLEEQIIKKPSICDGMVAKKGIVIGDVSRGKPNEETNEKLFLGSEHICFRLLPYTALLTRKYVFQLKVWLLTSNHIVWEHGNISNVRGLPCFLFQTEGTKSV